MKNSNEIKDRSYLFSLRIFKICRHLDTNKFNRNISSQLFRSGTSIGANVEEAVAAHSRKDFISKLTIALKEARESLYWLRLIRDSETIPIEKMSSLIDESEQLIKILVKIIITSKKTSAE